MSPPEEHKAGQLEGIELQAPCQKPDEDGMSKQETSSNKGLDILYSVEDVPPWHVTFLLAFQHYMTMCCGAVIIPYLLGPKMCIREDDPARGYLIATSLFVSGIGTLLQTTVGLRLPLVQGPSGAFLVPTFVILNFPKWQCPDWSNSNITKPGTEEEWQEMWQVRMREIQGSVIMASLVEIGIGLTGIIGIIKAWISPLVVVPIISLIALSFLREVSSLCSGHWGIAFFGMFFMTLFSQYLRDVNVPYFYWRKKKFSVGKFPFFKLYPVLLSLLVMWAICAILTATNAIPPGNAGRTDLPSTVMDRSPWFRFPYPVQWGVPTFTGSAVIGMISGVLSSTVESVGDYHALAKISGVGMPPLHAINRGIFMEGTCCILGGLWGTGGGLTSYSTNIAVVGITKVASRRVVQYTAILLLLLGTCGKFSAMFLLIPPPVLGGVFCVLFALVCSVGLSNLQYVDLNSSRNLYILGSSLFLGLCVPQWLKENRGVIQTGSQLVDQVLSVILTNSMAVGGILAFFLDNTIPGTAEERGLTQWKDQSSVTSSDQNAIRCYEIPFCKKLLERMPRFAYLPISPTFKKYPGSKSVKKVTRCFKTGKQYPVQETAKEAPLDT